MGVDPLADAAPGWTPYRYGFNNPIVYLDPTGMSADTVAPPSGPRTVLNVFKQIPRAFAYAYDQLSLKVTGNDIETNLKKIGEAMPDQGSADQNDESNNEQNGGLNVHTGNNLYTNPGMDTPEAKDGSTGVIESIPTLSYGSSPGVQNFLKAGK